MRMKGNKQNTGIKLLALLGTILVIVAIAFFLSRHVQILPNKQVTRPNKALLAEKLPPGRVPSIEQLSERVKSLKSGKAYKDGEDYWTRLERSSVDYKPSELQSNMYQSYAISSYLAQKFASTITSKELEIMRENGILSVGALSPEQKAALLKLVGPYTSIEPIENTTLLLWRPQHLKGYIFICWITWNPQTKSINSTTWGLADHAEDVQKTLEKADPQPDIVSAICKRKPK
jgi:hypothetical protein